uniref:ImmA/IrrE family metallo-endopeptidase n=1 Tax=Megamonas funiformis TaxID=437897 RepID=UPI0035613985
MNNKLEQKILDLKKEYQQDKYHNSDKNIDDIDKNVIIDQANKVSNEVLNVFFKDEEPPLKIASLMKKLGFDLFKNSQFPQKELSGLLALNLKEKLAGKYSDKVIIVNGQDSIGHQRFTIAHELAHYIFDA